MGRGRCRKKANISAGRVITNSIDSINLDIVKNRCGYRSLVIEQIDTPRLINDATNREKLRHKIEFLKKSREAKLPRKRL